MIQQIKQSPQRLNDWIPVNLNCKQTTEVRVIDNKLKLQIKRESFSAEELVA